jgi:hypothetical protein
VCQEVTECTADGAACAVSPPSFALPRQKHKLAHSVMCRDTYAAEQLRHLEAAPAGRSNLRANGLRQLRGRWRLVPLYTGWRRLSGFAEERTSGSFSRRICSVLVAVRAVLVRRLHARPLARPGVPRARGVPFPATENESRAYRHECCAIQILPLDAVGSMPLALTSERHHCKQHPVRHYLRIGQALCVAVRR